MFGRLHYRPDDYYRMGLPDVIAAIEGFSDGGIEELNKMRHLMWASLAAFGGSKTPSPKKILPLPTDVEETNAMTLEDFNNLRELYSKHKPKAEA